MHMKVPLSSEVGVHATVTFEGHVSLEANLVSGEPTLMAGISFIRSVKAAILRLRSAFSSARRRLSRSFRCSKNISSRSDEEVIACSVQESECSVSSLSCSQLGVQGSEEAMASQHSRGSCWPAESGGAHTSKNLVWKQVAIRHPFQNVCRPCGVLQGLPSSCNRCTENASEQQLWHSFFWQRGTL